MTVQDITSLFPQFKFVAGNKQSWNPRTQTVTYNAGDEEPNQIYGLLHEVSHGLLGHNQFHNDIQLIKMERDAWAEAQKIAARSHIRIPVDHIDACMDTYRDWLYARSKCPKCELVGYQTDRHEYSCIHCRKSWQVPASRLCSVRRTIVI